MKGEDQEKTAFQSHSGQYQNRVMPYGVIGGPRTFQKAMNHILSPLLRKCVIVFIDDNLIYSQTWKEHLQHITMVLKILQEHEFKVNLSKCSFVQQKLHYLGHVINPEGVATYPKKVAIVQNWPTPINVKDVRSFLGMAGYYRKFVQNFGLIGKPLTNLLKKGEQFVWTRQAEEAFQTLKRALVTAPVLSMPNFSQTFEVETDASDKGIGAILQQNGHPIAFISKALGPKNQGLSTYEKECLTILNSHGCRSLETVSSSS
jgi:hypothetical protein